MCWRDRWRIAPVATDLESPSVKTEERVLDCYEAQSDIEAVAEEEAAYRSTTTMVMKIPVKLVPAVRALLAKRRAS
jgi:hypothetical protein